MYKRTVERSRFDSVALVNLGVHQLPDGSLQKMEATLCYVDSKTGVTFGYVTMVHEPMRGLETLSPAAQEAWSKFCAEIEKQQGRLLFGEGSLVQLDLGLNDSQPESEDEVAIGLGGGT
jgi:hypothetical protein